MKEYQGERVVTLAEMDDAFNQPAGTAERAFRTHRGRLLEDTDYFEVWKPNELRRLGLYGRSVLLTEHGYLMLMKAFQGYESWKVHRELIRHYTRSKGLQTVQDFEEYLPIARLVEEKQREGMPPAAASA